MSRLDHDRLTNLLADAVALPVARRGAFLDSTCLGEPELRRELEELLACSERASAVFDVASQQIVQSDPQRIGSYQILEPIGEGGMAIVYRAQQGHPVRRIVAIKLIKLGMDTRQFVARFEAERQALAMMDHPSIAKVHDAGATETGRPYFVMEYVPGLPILEFCDQMKLDLRRRLELFMQVCDAVEHAHRNGIIHRDIKNSNVLVMEVNGKAVPKVIDFGVAKALSQRLTERTLQTEQGQLIGTPEYMSPEQAERGALDIDTRSDVYSLGVLLYELISGVQPIPSEVLRNAGFEQVQRIIRETEPQRPSTRLSTLAGSDAMAIAQRRSTPLPTLIRNLRSELEWIPLKAMRKNREQRYRSPSELADDVRNYLDGRPLIAGPESRRYRARKFLRRHKTGVAASAGMILLLVGGIAATTWQAIRATRAQETARAALEEARNANASMRAVNDFLTQDLLGSANPAVSLGEDLTVKKALDSAAAAVGERFKDRPLTEASIRNSVAVTYAAIGREDLALPHARSALEIRVHLLGDDHPQTLESMTDVAKLLVAQGNYSDAETLARRALDRLRRLGEQDYRELTRTLQVLSNSLRYQGKQQQARELDQEALRISLDHLGEADSLTLVSMHNLAVGDMFVGDYHQAEPVLRRLLAVRRSTKGDDHPDTLRDINDLARALQNLGKQQESEHLLREALQTRRRVLTNDHPETVLSLLNLASLYEDLHRLEEAEQLLREALQTNQRMGRGDQPHTTAIMNNLASVLRQSGKLAEAETLFRQVVPRCRELFGPDHPYSLGTMNNLAKVLLAQGRLAEAEPLFGEVFRRTPPIEHDPKWKAIYMCGWGECLAKMQQYSSAEAPLREAYGQLLSIGQHSTAEMRGVIAALAEVCDHTNRPDEAAEWRAKLTELQAATGPATRPN